MTLQIGKNIEEVSRRILGDDENPPDTTLANDIARDGIKALISGMGTLENGVVTKVTDDWKNLMRHFAADNSRELERLCGQDRDFNGSEWGMHCLAYIVGDSTCTSETTMRGGTRRSMLLVDELANPSRNMLENLDAEGGALAGFGKTQTSSIDTSQNPDAEAEDLSYIESPITDASDDKD